MKNVFYRLLNSLPCPWKQEQQDPANTSPNDKVDVEEQGPEPCTLRHEATELFKKTKTVTIKEPSEVIERRSPTDNIMKYIDQIEDGELTRAELEKITGALRRKLKGHYNRHSLLSSHKSFTQTPSKVAPIHRDSNYFLNDMSSNLSLFADNPQPSRENSSDISSIGIDLQQQQQQQQTMNFAPSLFKFDSISTIKPRDEDEGNEDASDNEISAIEPVANEKASKAIQTGPIRRNRRRNHGRSVPWSKGDCSQQHPREQQQQDFCATPGQTNLFCFQSEPLGTRGEGEDKRSFSEALDEIYKKRTSDAAAEKIYNFNPEHRAPSPMKEHPLTQCNGVFSSLEPILK